MIPILQARWKIENNKLRYYGLRSYPYTFKKDIKLNKRTLSILNSLDAVKSIDEFKTNRQFKKLVKQRIIIDKPFKLQQPSNISEAVFCKTCSADNYTIPGLEFNSLGICPICENFPSLKNLHNILPVQNTIKPSVSLKYDAALFYTGGKDSSFLLHYLSNTLKLRILALTWDIPFMSDTAKQNMEAAKHNYPNVQFKSSTFKKSDLTLIYNKIYQLQNNVCICPFPAYMLFIDQLREHKIPYLILGNEPAQCLVHIFNKQSHKIYYHPLFQSVFRMFFNAQRLISFKKPLRKGQIEMLILLKTLAYGQSELQKALRIENQTLSNIHKALSENKNMMCSFQQRVKECEKDANLPSLIHMDFNQISKGVYKWDEVLDILKKESSWTAPLNNSQLHTSCKIEAFKDYTQHQAFLNMQSSSIPFSALEMSIAVNMGALSRDEAIKQVLANPGLTSCPKESMQLMCGYL